MNLLYNIRNDKFNFSFLPTGDIYSIEYGDIMINQFKGVPKDGSLNQIYLRLYDNNKSFHVYPLIGSLSKSSLSFYDDRIVYTGAVEDVEYRISFIPHHNTWFWDLEFWGSNKDADLLYGQDIGIANKFGVLTNELYISQYIDHSIYEGEWGYTICSRQNQCQDKIFPYIRQGSLGIKSTEYCTDGTQFFGNSYKDTNVPQSLCNPLPNINYQYEFAYIGLRTEKFNISKRKNFAFYGFFLENHPLPVTQAEFTEEIICAYQDACRIKSRTDSLNLWNQISIKEEFQNTYSSPIANSLIIDTLFPNRKLEEYNGQTLLSFYTPNHAHIVTKEKELLTERPHGTILTNCISKETVDLNILSTTNYMFGLFNSQTVISNTSFHKFLSVKRDSMNIQKNSGQRIYIKLNGTYKLLTMPALYEMGVNYSKWYYILEDDILVISSFISAHDTSLYLDVTSKNQQKYDYIVTNQLVLGEHEFMKEIVPQNINNGYRFFVDSPKYPELYYDLQICGCEFLPEKDSLFYTDETIPNKSINNSLLVLPIKEKDSFQIRIHASLDGNSSCSPPALGCCTEEYKKALCFYENLINKFHLTSDNPLIKEKFDILNETSLWYTHNAMIHYSSPHGLEQPGGAAWGTRDICQGPMEYFRMTQNYTLMRSILCNIFSHQNEDDAQWPQWFMFDKYDINAGECHGDVIFWPLKCLSDYIHSSGDYSILEEKVPYGNTASMNTLVQTIYIHIKQAIEQISTRFIENTGLITYAGGDWDDTLQPASDSLKEHLVSSWTVALAYQTLTSLGNMLKKYNLDTTEHLSIKCFEMTDKIYTAFQTILINDGIITGFLNTENGYEYMLHPNDTKTGIHYRLLPMTRSIIAELSNTEQALRNIEIIDNNLKCPDGVRLMDKPANYNGGVSTLFKRAEQAANVGREISLQYTHAHIRYIEALAKLGLKNRAFEELFTINPILITKTVPNALYRQSNLYFSSSEGNYKDRYEYEKDFHKLKDGTIDVKGGWRLYSSGPGIYLNQIISNILGIRFSMDGLILDPVIPDSFHGAEFTYMCFGVKVIFKYYTNSSHFHVKKNNHEVGCSLSDNRYRNGAILIDKKQIIENDTSNIILDIYTV